MFRTYLNNFPITFSIIASCLAVFILGNAGILDVRWIVAFPGQLSLGTLLSHFAHLDTLHLLFNMFALLQLGPLLERRLGSTMYILALLGTWLLTVALLQPVLDAPTLGFSGILMGIISLLICMFYHIPQIRSQLMFWLFINIFIGLAPGTNISFFGHLMGAVAGFVVYGVYAMSSR